MATGSSALIDAPAAALTSYVPTVALDWLAEEPDVRHRRIDASMVFVDISGFTALSERLAGFGREGAEEITALLQHVFERLLAVAYANRGSLMKFGGDALFLLFHGEDHPRRAACSADGMRRELIDIGALDSLAGKVRLGMTVGAHSGDYDLFLVGDTHRELIITGPGASTVVRNEESAETGQVIVSREMATRIDRDWLRGPLGLGIELGRTPGAELGGEVEVVPKTHDATRLVPTAIRRYVTAGGVGAEHRQAVVAFVAYHGSDELLEQEGPGACADALESLVARVSAACDAHDITLLGSDVAPGGGKLIMVGGAPVGHDDDVERVLRAAREVAARPHPFEIHIGVNPGPLFAGVVGPPYRLTYTVMGDTVNLAARLAYKVGDRGVLTTRETLGRTRSRFAAEPVEPFLVKGKTEPIQAAIVGPPREAQLDMREPLPLIGREPELELLTTAIEATETDGGRVVELVGPAGIGKSRLLREFRDAHPERRLYYGGCTSYEQSTPYFAFRALVRFLLDLDDDSGPEELITRLTVVDRDLAPWAALIGHVVDIAVEPSDEVAALDPKFLPTRLRTAVGDLLQAILPARSILRIEDVNWVDEASRSLIEHLVRTVLPETSWLLVLTSRAPTFPELAHDTLTLEPLGARAVERLAHTAAERGMVSLELAVQLAQRAQGNPLFLQELLAFAGGSAQGEIPDSVERLIAARLDQLQPQHRDLLRQAALLGNRFDLGLLRSITGDEINGGDLDVLEAFVSPDEATGDYVFEHDLYREVAYQALPYRRRRELHDRAGRLIETRYTGRTDEAAEILALHYYRAGRHDRAWEHNRVAAERARDRHANADAVRFYRWALESGTRSRRATSDDKLRIREQMAELLELMGAYDRAEDVLAVARRQAPEPRRPDLWYRSGIVRERLGQTTQALRFYGRAIQALASFDDRPARELAIRVRQRRAEIRLSQSRASEVLDEVRSLLDEAERLGVPELIANAHHDLAWAVPGDDAARDHARRSLELFEQLGRARDIARVHQVMAQRASAAVRWGEASEALRLAGAAFEAAGDTIGAAVMDANAAIMLLLQARAEEAYDVLEPSLSVFRAASYKMGIGMVTGQMGRAKVLLGDLHAGRAFFEEAIAALHEAGIHVNAWEMAARRAEALLFAAEFEQALAAATDVVSQDRPGLERARLVAERVAATVHALRGDADRALAELERIRGMAEDASRPDDAALADAVLAWMLRERDPERAAVARARAEATCESLGIVIDPERLALGPLAVSPPA